MTPVSALPPSSEKAPRLGLQKDMFFGAFLLFPYQAGIQSGHLARTGRRDTVDPGVWEAGVLHLFLSFYRISLGNGMWS